MTNLEELHPDKLMDAFRPKVSTEDGLTVLRLPPEEAKKLVKILRSPAGHCDWCDSVPECTEECIVPSIDLTGKIAGA